MSKLTDETVDLWYHDEVITAIRDSRLLNDGGKITLVSMYLLLSYLERHDLIELTHRVLDIELPTPK